MNGKYAFRTMLEAEPLLRFASGKPVMQATAWEPCPGPVVYHSLAKEHLEMPTYEVFKDIQLHQSVKSRCRLSREGALVTLKSA